MFSFFQIVNLEYPYVTSCIKNRKLEKLHNTDNSYSKPGCLMQCLGQFVIARCGCRPVEYRDLQVPLCAASDTVLCLFPTYSKLQLQRCFKQYHDQFVSIKCFNNRQLIVDRYIRWLLRQFILSKFN